MPLKKMRVELFGRDGNKYTITVNGQITREKAVAIFDMVEFLGGEDRSSILPIGPGSKKIDKLEYIIDRYFPLVWFYAKEIKETYEKEIKEKINISVVSTYLSRLAERGFLLKDKKGNLCFKLVSPELRHSFIIK